MPAHSSRRWPTSIANLYHVRGWRGCEGESHPFAASEGAVLQITQGIMMTPSVREVSDANRESGPADRARRSANVAVAYMRTTCDPAIPLLGAGSGLSVPTA